jgi:hypothetical protein
VAATIADAVIERLRSVAPADVVVYDNEVPGVPAARYWVLYCGVGIWSATTYGGAFADNSVTFQLTTVASDQSGQQVAAQMCRWLEARGIAALLGFRPLVTGLSCSAVSQVPLDNWPSRDESVAEIPTVYAVDRFTLRATTA